MVGNKNGVWPNGFDHQRLQRGAATSGVGNLPGRHRLLPTLCQRWVHLDARGSG